MTSLQRAPSSQTMRLLLTIAILVSTSSAHADKSPAAATTISVGATIVPFVAGVMINKRDTTVGPLLMLGAGVIGPSAGHLYAGRMSWVGVGLRAGGLGASALVLAGNDGCLIGEDDGPRCSQARYLFWGGLAVFTGGVIYDWMTSGDSARRANRRESALQIAPTVIAGPRTHGAGLGLRARF